MKSREKVWQLASLLLIPALLHGCGGGGGSGSATSTYISDEVEFLVNYMEKSYLFFRDIQANDVSNVSTPEQALELRRAKQDKFSNIASAETSDALFVEGKTTAFGFNQKLEDDKLLRIIFVQPNSPAQAAGLKRGDAIVAVDGESVASLLAASRLNNAFGPIEIGIRRTVSVMRGNQSFDLALVKASFSLQTASLGKTIALTNGSKAGYLYYNSFTTPSLSQWKTALATMKTQGATKLVVDLRINGGGLVNIATSLGATLVGSNEAGKLFLQTAFNEKSTPLVTNYTIPFDTLAGTFSEVVFLTSPASCSASEALIIGIQPYLPTTKVTLIGGTTCGKPYGFSPPEYKSKLYNITSFRLKNSVGFTDYVDGLVPNCKATDNAQLELGDEKESLLSAALGFLNNGTCPVVASSLTSALGGPEKDFKEPKLTERASDYWHIPKENIALETGIQ
jgi:carboxyl-terminal processing protease